MARNYSFRKIFFVGALLVAATAIFLFWIKLERARAELAPVMTRWSRHADKNQRSYLKIPILMYHHVADREIHDPYYVSPGVFARQMEWLKENNYHVISYDEFFQALTNSTTLPANPAVITFDDGDEDQYTNAFPVLKKFNFPAMFYIITARVDKKNFISWEQLKEMAAEGMEIGSHTVTHPDLPRVTSSLEWQLTDSRRELEKHLGFDVKFFAYPGGAHSPRVEDALKDAGYLSAVTTRHWIWHSRAEDPYLVPRIHIDDDLDSFKNMVKGVRLN